MKTKHFILSLALSLGLVTSSFAHENPIKVSQKSERSTLDPSKSEVPPNIVGVAIGNDNFTTLVAAVKAAGLVETLSGNGPFTVFAPVNSAFAKLPAGTVEYLLKPENKAALTSILTYHVVAGKFDAAQVVKAINDNNGKFVIKTVNGDSLTASLNDGKVHLMDTKGNHSTVVIADVDASNGIIHAIDTVVMPN
ncbi:fasciclin domain-containing protein [Namhaeicola litoreus]|uniref:Fasciclin domain-containing protein n=1 Tax=Namhaeicola litoreus TaxID=1052145 RepID=A0ABW3Y722_9FLAO